MPLPIAPPTPTAYATAYQVLNPAPGTVEHDRRAVERQPFRFVQRIAAYDGQQRIDQLRFFPVQCHDISRRGIAFLLPGRLDFSRLVIELGSEEERMYFEAEAVNFRRLSGYTTRRVEGLLASMGGTAAGPGAVLIGCRFVTKLDL